ncbi:ribonuclease domain-containing protein [Spongiactinospora sp. TRM90649]|uniref:ribonuclease domain-containing protein n=1 Tax=Spongiactinospora sp. TRM90649 TaxID=3031114 RepID=UPI0023F8CC86|nr:ribonuclease domain-containing protein [Spongiactinospora sp. TRM90649]MDF5751925.1 ribonuclease domain-containing protein [Spongiactinospora sp. TRM90649]
MRRGCGAGLALAALVGLGWTASPAPAGAEVFPACEIRSCRAALKARDIWAAKGYPADSGWYTWPGGLYNFSGGRFFNHERQLPAGGAYQEYDVEPRPRGASRNAHRIVIDIRTRAAWFSPDHYGDFHRLGVMGVASTDG